MAKKALIEKANRKPKFKVRGYTRCRAAVVPVRCTASSACAVCAARDGPRGRSPASPRRAGEGV
jgi:small subunit ribosomal protein S14